MLFGSVIFFFKSPLLLAQHDLWIWVFDKAFIGALFWWNTHISIGRRGKQGPNRLLHLLPRNPGHPGVCLGIVGRETGRGKEKEDAVVCLPLGSRVRLWEKPAQVPAPYDLPSSPPFTHYILSSIIHSQSSPMLKNLPSPNSAKKAQTGQKKKITSPGVILLHSSSFWHFVLYRAEGLADFILFIWSHCFWAVESYFVGTQPIRV